MGHTILLADDSITIQKVIELTFSDEDFKLHTVGNGQKAIEELNIVNRLNLILFTFLDLKLSVLLIHMMQKGL